MATLEQLERGLRAADAAGNVDDARAFANAIRSMRSAPEPEPAPNPAEGMSAWERGLAGAGGALSRLRNEIFPPASPVEALTMQPGYSTRQRQDDLATYERNKEALGTAGTVGEIGAEVAATMIPLAKAGSAAGRLPVFAKAMGRAAPVAGDVAVNAAYSGATAGEGNRGSAALAGGAGAAGGHFFQKALGMAARGAKPNMSPEARTLYEAGITPTPGQMFGDGPIGQVLRSTEDKFTSAPLVGDIIRGARTRSLEQYNNVEINRALSYLSKTVRGSGEDTVASAQRMISDAYDQVLPETFLQPWNAIKATQSMDKYMKEIPLLTDEQEGKILQFIARKVHPLIGDANAVGKPIDGKTAKALDAEIGHYAREFSNAADPGAHPLGEAFYTLQTALREGLEGTTPEAKLALGRINTAYRNMLPVVKASDRGAAQGGRFTPLQLHRAAQSFEQGGDDLNRAARRVLPSTVPNSGTADRLGIVALANPKIAAATAIAAVLYSRPGVYFMVNGLSGAVPDKVLKAVADLPPKQAIEAMMRLADQNPAIGQVFDSLFAQLGRTVTTQQQPGEQQ